MGGLIRLVVLAISPLAIAACSPRIVYRDVKPSNTIVVEPCVATDPPRRPNTGGCTFDTEDECRHMHDAIMADYADALERWVELAVLPRCAIRP
jgi:hypothetical protein